MWDGSATRELQLRADAGDSTAQLKYQRLLEHVGINKSQAARCYKSSGYEENADSQFPYVALLEHGDGLEMDKARRAHYCQLRPVRGPSKFSTAMASFLWTQLIISMDTAHYFKHIGGVPWTQLTISNCLQTNITFIPISYSWTPSSSSGQRLCPRNADNTATTPKLCQSERSEPVAERPGALFRPFEGHLRASIHWIRCSCRP
jgi:hypothetical protein